MSRAALPVILLLALSHALFQAAGRPFLQVSDEMAYIHAAQEVALQGSPAGAHSCVAPPDGQLLPLGNGGKRGFRAVTGWFLATLCREGGTFPLFALRAIQAVAFPVVAGAAFLMARLLAGPVAGLLAGFTIAVHPVAAKYAGGVTPDAWANAAAAMAFLSGTRLLLGRGRWWDIPALAAATAMGLLWKETTYVLVAHLVLVLAVVLVRLVATRRSPGQRAAVLLPLAATIVIALTIAPRQANSFSSAYQASPERLVHLRAAGAFGVATAVASDMGAHFRGIVGSSVLSLYRPWVYGEASSAGQPLTPPSDVLVLTATWGLGVIGLLVMFIKEGTSRIPVILGAVWLATMVLCLAQPSVRQVLLDASDLHQGRWLFPVLAPWAAIVGVGLEALVRLATPRAVPLLLTAGLTGLWIVVIDLVGHYFVRFPDVLRQASIFVRPTGDYPVDDQLVFDMVSHVTVAQPVSAMWTSLILLATGTLLVLWVSRRTRTAACHE